MTSVATRTSLVRNCLIVLLAFCAGGCASMPGRTTNADPLQGFNRSMYKFNDTLDRAALKPVAKGYKKITPGWMRSGVSNFFGNLGYPTVVLNQFLQGKFKTGLQDTGRLLANTTLGLGGLFDVASHMGLPANSEDFGQTLAVWGVSSGPYLTLPLVGPSSMRDAPSKIVDYFTGVLRNTDYVSNETEWGLRAVEIVSNRAELLSVDSTINQAFDPYRVIRDAWVQRREYQVYDGNPPEELEDETTDQDDSAPKDAKPEDANPKDTNK
jgi:phospholipid-binding lipoprotein MlaA